MTVALQGRYVPRSRKKGALLPGGFTLVELLIVIAIIAILAGIAMPLYLQFLQRAASLVGVNDLKSLVREIDQFRLERGRLPVSLAEIGWTKNDPWGNPYEYLDFSTVKGTGKMRKDHFMVPINTEYDLYSKGKDGKSASPLTADISQDDIIVANDGAYIGLAASF